MTENETPCPDCTKYKQEIENLKLQIEKLWTIDFDKIKIYKFDEIDILFASYIAKDITKNEFLLELETILNDY